eukprot:gene9929-13357_t
MEELVSLISSSSSRKILNGPTTTIFLLLNTMIGSGILVQAYVFKETGIILSIITYLVISGMTLAGVLILIYSATEVHLYDYATLAFHALGEIGSNIFDISIVLNNAGCLLSYIIIIGTLLKDVVQTYTSSTAFYLNEIFLTVLAMICFVFPICFYRRYGHLSVVSYISIMAISSCMVLIVFVGPAISNNSSDSLTLVSFYGLFNTIGSVVFALGYTTAIFHSYISMEPCDPEVFTLVAIKSTVVGSLMCFVTGLVGYLSFRDSTDSDILQNFTGTIGVVFKLIVIIHLILYIPGDYIIMRCSLLNLLKVDVLSLNNYHFTGITLTTLIIIVTFACILLFYGSTSSLSIVLNITGGIAGSLTNFILPGLCGLFILGKHKVIYIICVSLITVGTAIAVMVIADSISEIKL